MYTMIVTVEDQLLDWIPNTECLMLVRTGENWEGSVGNNESKAHIRRRRRRRRRRSRRNKSILAIPKGHWTSQEMA
jgi:hypothetical protein